MDGISRRVSGTKRPHEGDLDGQDARAAPRPKTQVQPSVTLDSGSSSFQQKKSSEEPLRPTTQKISISMKGLSVPKNTGVSLSRKNPLAQSPKASDRGSSSSMARPPSPEKGKLLTSGPNPLKGKPFWKELDLADHFRDHRADTKSKNIAEYEDKSLALMNAPVTKKAPAYVRKFGLENGSRAEGDVVRHDTETNELGVAQASGKMRTFHNRNRSDPGHSGLVSESADDYARGLKGSEPSKK